MKSLFALCASLTALSPALAADWNITDPIPLERVIVQGHRGVGYLAKENTIEAYHAARQANAGAARR